MGTPASRAAAVSLPEVVFPAGPEVHLGQRRNGHLGSERGLEIVRRHDPKLRAALPEQAHESFSHVQVGGEVRLLGQHHPPRARTPQQGGEQLEEVEGHRVGGDHLVLPGAEQRRDPRPHPLGQPEPAVTVPRRDEVTAPLVGEQGLDPRAHSRGRGAERVPVEVDHPLGELEPVPERGQRIGPVPVEERPRGVSGRRGGSRSPRSAFTGGRSPAGRGAWRDYSARHVLPHYIALFARFPVAQTTDDLSSVPLRPRRRRLVPGALRSAHRAPGEGLARDCARRGCPDHRSDGFGEDARSVPLRAGPAHPRGPQRNADRTRPG